jgi:hypothetical protein
MVKKAEVAKTALTGSVGAAKKRWRACSMPDPGKITVNGKDLDAYGSRDPGVWARAARSDRDHG